MDKWDQINIFDITIDKLSMAETVRVVSDWALSDLRKNRYVVTPNVDHLVLLDENPTFKKAYESASLVVADGKPVVWASKILGKGLPETVTGSDLVPNIFDFFQNELQKPLNVYLLGAMPGVAERAKKNILNRWPKVNIVGCASPEIGFDRSEERSIQIAHEVAVAKPDLVIFGVGAPKQEIWSYRYSHLMDTKVILCVGATIDFLAGEKNRAPLWVRNIGMEWMHRMIKEPKRLVKRYMHDALVFPKLLYRACKSRS